MIFVDNLDKNEYEKFVRNNKFRHFMQSYDFGRIKEYKNFKPHYVGLKEDNKLICACLLLEKKLLFNYTYFYSPRGYVIDFNNKELLRTFTKELKQYAKKKKAIFIKIDPAIKLHDLDQDGNIIGNNNNYDLIKYLTKLGYKHGGYSVGFEKEQPRFTFRINLDKPWDEIYSKIHPTTRKILNKGNQYNLNIYVGNENDIMDFYTTMLETSKRENIIQSSIEYYKQFFTIFNKDNLSDIYIVKANINEIIQSFNNKIKKVMDEINSLDHERYKNKEKSQNKINDLNKQLNKLYKEIEEIKKIKEKELVLSSIITVKYGDTIWTVHGGNNSLLMDLNANYLCYYQIMKDAYDNGYKIMDCFGTCGIPNPQPNNPIYGIHSFKKRLGGEYIEFIGEFDLIINKLLYKIYNLLIPIYRKLK